MPFLDTLQAGMKRVIPQKNESIPALGVGHGFGAPDDDMIVSKPAIIFSTCQIFFNFLALCCFAAVAAFQSKWHIGVSGLSGFAIFVSLLGMFYSAFILLVPVFYEKYDKFVKLARALREVRVSFILCGTGVAVSLLIAFVTTISAFTEPGCKNAANDPHASLGDSFQSALPGWCDTKKAGAVFFWLAFIFWLCALGLTLMDWRTGKLNNGPRDPPFVPPAETYEMPEEDDDGDERRDRHTDLNRIPSAPAPRRQASDSSDANPSSPFNDRYQNDRYQPGGGGGGGGYNPPYAGGGGGGYNDAARTSSPPTLPMPRTSMDTYGAFNDPPPSGFGGGFSSGGGAPTSPGGGMSRTMQYADPYAAVRSQITHGAGAQSGPPSYEGYTGYR